MPLWDEVAARYSEEHLVGLTNPDKRDATAIDQGRADAAVKDAKAELLTRLQEEYDETVDQHVVAAVGGVVAYLMRRGGAASGISKISLTDYREELDRIYKARKGRRILPKTISPLEPTDESKEADLKPDFDRSRFRDLVPEKRGETRYFDHLVRRDA